MLIAILVLSTLSAFFSLIAACGFGFLAWCAWLSVRDEQKERAAADQKATAQKQDVNGEN